MLFSGSWSTSPILPPIILPICSITRWSYEERKPLIEWCQTRIIFLIGSSSCFFLSCIVWTKIPTLPFLRTQKSSPLVFFTGHSEKSVRMEMQKWFDLLTCSALVYSCLIFHSKPQHLSQLGARKLCASMFSIRPGWGFPLAYNLSLLS